MRPAEISNEAIIDAGQALLEHGRNVTGFALRQKVGGGNPSRLKQVWDEHVRGQTVTQAEPVAELPVEVAEAMAAVTQELNARLSALAIELNDKAVKAAERRVAEVVRAAGEQRAQAERELADAAQAVDDLETQLEAKNADIVQLKHEHAELAARGQAQAVELAQLRERLTYAEQASQEIDQVRTDRDEARSEVARAREEAAELRGEVRALQEQQTGILRAIEGRVSGHGKNDS